MLNSIELSNFRGFSSVVLQGLQRVNLIVGRNNSGKTSLLEAIAFLSRPKQPQEMAKLLRPQFGNAEQRYFRWLMKDEPKIRTASITGQQEGMHREVLFFRDQPRPLLQAQVQSGYDQIHNGAAVQIMVKREMKPLGCKVVSVEPMQPQQLVALFANAVKRRRGEEQIEGMLREMDGRIQKIRVYPAPDGNQIEVDLGLSEMLPLTQVGQGINRLVAIFSELVGAQPDVCIIDEIENGIHHSLLEQVWKGIAVAAESLNVQVFATTHSYECIEAAHAAFSKRKTYDLGIIQLFRVESRDQGRLLDRK
ncbi:MAG TPA: AAA family ATPase, partial [Candidatus Udaeobacter sp.]